MLTKREVFDKVKAHLLQQGERSATDSSFGYVCRYRAPDGKMCAIGVLIKDEFYKESILEGMSVHEVPVLDALVKSGVPARDWDTNSLLVSLQITHDVMAPDEWEETLEKLEQKHFGGV